MLTYDYASFTTLLVSLRVGSIEIERCANPKAAEYIARSE